jgi:hypothetical protein
VNLNDGGTPKRLENFRQDYMKRVGASYGSKPQMSSAEFNAALKRHGFRVVRAKIEDATGQMSWRQLVGRSVRSASH